MFNIESYITPILLSYVEKYVKDFRPADAQVSLWGGGVALHNLVLKPDVLQQVVALPFTLVSGRIHELLIRVPWTKIMSEPITITIDTIECILSLHSPPEESPQPESPRNQVVEAPPGYMRALVRRVVSNISVRVHHLIVKYVQDDIVLSLNIKHLAVDSADSNWNPAFADIEVGEPALRRLVRLDDLTLCLDRADADGKIRFYQEPLLYRCQLDFRVLTRLVSAKRLRPLSVWVRAKATRLAGGASNEQLALLVRLLRERPPPPTPPAATPLLVPPPQAGSSTTSLEGVRTESWTEWAWSWLPASDEAEDVAPSVPVPVPLTFTVYFDDVSFTFKMMETDMNGKRRARPVLQLVATHTAVKFSKCAPTSLRLRAGARLLELRAHGKCVCGQLLPTHANYEPTIYLSSIEKSEEPWIWPEENFGGRSVETGLAVDEQFRASPEPNEASEGNLMETQWWKEVPQDGDNDELWEQMAPVVFIEYCHDRAPPDSHINPYDKPPLDFEYSDWAEECSISIRVQPLQLELCGGLLHRVAAVADLALHLPPHQEPEQSIRTLTLEECEALSNNVPQRRCDVEVSGLVVRVWPWQHPPPSHRAASPLLLDFELPLAVATISAPLYTYRVCSAACQMPEDEALVWSCARAHVTLNVNGATACVRAADTPPKAIAHADIRATSHRLLHAHLFKHYATVHNSYTFNIREAGVCGSVARLTAAYEILTALRRARPSNLLNNTTLVYDALHDEEMVSLDASLEQLTLRGYATLGLRTNIISLHAVRASAIHTPKDGENKQAWLFSGPEAPTTSPYLRMAVQWETDAGVGAGSIARKEESEQLRTVEFIGAWLEPTAVSADPLLLAALAYLPRVTLSSVDSQSNLITGKSVSSSLHSMLRRPTPPSSSGRGGSRAGSGAEVHARPRSTASSAERTELMQAPPTPRPNDTRNTLGKKVAWWWSGEHAVQMHARLRRALACCELGLVQVYVPAQSVPARGSRPLRGMGGLAGLRDAIESHAANKPVLVFSLGHLTMHSNAMVKHLWNDIRHDGPTYIAAKPELTLDSFPWRVRIADVSCYTLEARRPTEGVRGALKDTRSTAPRALLGLLTTTVTLSIVTKSLSVRLPTPTQRAPHVAHDEKVKYFTSGVDFKPSTLKEFIRGPSKHKRTNVETKASPEPTAAPAAGGPVVSLGVHVHADTPPITLHLDQDQVGVLADALHCLTHLALLLRRSSVPTPAPTYPPVVPAINKSLIRSVSEQEERETPSERTPSDNRSDLIPIFEASAIKLETKTFIWVQWVISRATVAVSTGRARLAADVDDIIATVDLQPHYSQLKLKLASASLRHFRRSESDEWEAGAMGGRVLEAREPLDSKQDNHFLALTVTQAKISNLPASWREELHPKLLEQKSQGADSMWEVYVTLAPLEAVVQASVVRLAAAVMRLLRPRTAACPLRPPAPRPHSYLARTHAPLRSEWQLPFFYMSAGGLRLLLTEHGAESAEDDTLMLVIGKVTVNPHPENPICRRVVNACAETSGWVTGASAPDGRQYEALARGVALRSARFHQLVRQEVSEAEIMKGTGGENPALKWSQPTISPVITPIVHSVDVECVVAPAVVVCEEEGPTVACGPAFEINLASDCSIELGLHQLGLLVSLSDSMREALAHGQEDVDADEADEESNICPYSQLIPESLSPWPDTAVMPPTASSATVTPTTQANSTPVSPWTARSESMRGGMDSGVASAASHCAAKYSLSDEPLGPIKKNVSIALADHRVDPWEHFELFVTMGVIEACLYAADTGGSELAPLRAREPPLSDHVPVPAPPSATPGPASTTASPNDNTAPEDQPRPIVSFKDIKETSKKEDGRESATAGSSIAPDDIKSTDIDKTHFDLTNPLPQARKSEGYLQMIHISLQQPNLYYWRKETQRTLQVSLFDAGVALGGGTTRRVLLSTERGNRDPLTDIPPALATLRATLPTTSISTTVISNARGTLQLDIERPVLFDVCTDRLIRLHTIIMLVNKQLKQEKTIAEEDTTQSSLRKLRKLMTNHGLANVSLNTGQVGVRGSAGSAGWTSASAHVTAAVRPDRFNARVLLRSMFASAGAPCDARRPVLLPVNVGATVVATWEGWRRSGGTTGGGSSGAGGVRGALYADAVTLDLRPGDLEALSALHHAVLQLQQFLKSDNQDSWNNDGEKKPSTSSAASAASINSLEDLADHYYKDDLRSGAFRLVRGGQVPMAYQVRASVGALAWRYPHPRALTRLVAFPVPGLDEEMECVLEMFDSTLMRWEPHTYFHLPTGEPREFKLDGNPAAMVFALMWRVRLCPSVETEATPFLFDANKFMTQHDPLGADAMWSAVSDTDCGSAGNSAGGSVGGGVLTSEQLWGSMRIDSYFAPRLLPPTRVAMRLAAFNIYLHNEIPNLNEENCRKLEGLYVSRPLRRSHRVLSLSARDAAAHLHLGSAPAARRCLMHAHFSSDILDCTTGTMERFVEEFRAQASVLLTPVRDSEASDWRVRTCADHVYVSLNVPRVYTLQALANDWQHAYAQYVLNENLGVVSSVTEENEGEEVIEEEESQRALRGCVSLWLHNECGAALRVSQIATEELLPLGPDSMLAYRWHSPNEAKKLRFSLANPSTDWHWSNSIPFVEGKYMVRLEDPNLCLNGGGATNGKSCGAEVAPGISRLAPGAGVFIYARVTEVGPTRTMRLTGRLTLANMLRHPLLYKVRVRCATTQQWRAQCAGELSPERVSPALLCETAADLSLKVKFLSHDAGWSGDIPIKECPKENVPWLVKVPSGGEMAYVSVWCRVSRASSDGRLLATFWPLFVLRSHLSLDTEVMVTTELSDTIVGKSEGTEAGAKGAAPGLVQTALGRGATTHLTAPGTTAARHTLTLQYKNIDCPVTPKGVPLHYGITQTSVFDECQPVQDIDDVLREIKTWLREWGREARTDWPYSLVRGHWRGVWQPALLQPRTDITVQYSAVCAGGGCSLAAQLWPVMLLANAAPMPLTLRAHDAAPLCRLEPGHVVSPPSTLLKKPFFLSLEMGRETFVSEPLVVSSQEPGRYGALPSGHLALGHAGHIAIHCNHKVALFTLYLEVKEDMNILGITSTYVLRNDMDTDIMITCIAVPEGTDDEVVLNPKSFKVIPPSKDKRCVGEALCRAWIWSRWRSGARANTFLCVSLSHDSAVPVRLATPPEHAGPSPHGAQPSRRAIALRDLNNQSVPVVVTQHHHDGRWQVVVARDPCPQFVVYNATREWLAVAQADQPEVYDDYQQNTASNNVKAVRECEGARWMCTVGPGMSTHYTTPAYCARYPTPASDADNSDALAPIFLTFARATEDERSPKWCVPVGVVSGEQLVQLAGLTVKLRVRTSPHSTLLDLQHVQQHDISASDIRQRLVGSFSSTTLHEKHIDEHRSMERVNATENLMEISKSRLRQNHFQSSGNLNIRDDLILPPSDTNTIQSSNAKKLAVDVEKGPNARISLCGLERELTRSVLAVENEELDNSQVSIVQCLSEADQSSFKELLYNGETEEGGNGSGWGLGGERAVCEVRGVHVRLAAAADRVPLLALHLDNLLAINHADMHRGRATISVSSLQIDNAQYSSGEYDFAVVATSRAPLPPAPRWPPLWGAAPPQQTSDQDVLNLDIITEAWFIAEQEFCEITEVEVRVGALALYIEDAYVRQLAALLREAWPASDRDECAHVLAAARRIQRPLRLRSLTVMPIDLLLTLHTAAHMYIALDQSPLRLAAFRQRAMVTSVERLTHAFTVHYLSAALLSAGWVVGGLELVGAPVALAARVVGAGGGVRGVASATAAAVLRSLSAAASSLARNLDLLAGDIEHAERAAAARRQPPSSLLAGLAAGLTNFAINILGAVGGLAHHSVVGVCVGEAGGGTALRRGLVGALAKPLSATADLLAYAGQGLLAQTGWDLTPQPRSWGGDEGGTRMGPAGVWQRECVRWTFRLADLPALSGFRVLLDNAPLLLIITQKFLVVADPHNERIVEMIDLKSCSVQPLEGHVVELLVKQRRTPKTPDSNGPDEDNEYQISASAMARVARYTGAGSAGTRAELDGGVGGSAAGAGPEAGTRTLLLRTAPGQTYSLHAALCAAIQHNCAVHFPLL